MLKKHEHIIAAEEALARRIALGVIVNRPVKPLLQLIPGMFIFDFLKRNKEIRRFSQYYTFPRRVAMEVAREETHELAEEKIKAWLGIANLNAPAIVRAYMGILDVLIEHYKKLLRAEGETFNDFIRGVYETREGYKGHLNQLTTAERDLDRAVAETLGENNEVRQRLLEEQIQAQEQRNKEIDSIF